MKWTTGLSRNSDPTQAFHEACSALELGASDDPDLLLIFFSSRPTARLESMAVAIATEFPDALAIGCTADGVLGEAVQCRDPVCLSVTAGVLPGVDLAPLRFEPDSPDRVDFDRDSTGAAEGNSPNFLIASDPTSFETDALLASLSRQWPGCKAFGGLACPGDEGASLVLAGQVYDGGAVGVALSGNLRMDTAVAPACRPIGEPLIVTNHSQNVIHRFDRGNPMAVFRDLVGRLDDREQQLANDSMFVGLGVDSGSDEYQPGDFTVRNIVGFNPDNGDFAVAARIESLDVVQFHLLDPTTAPDQFDRAVDGLVDKVGQDPADGRAGVMFGCATLGAEVYGAEDFQLRSVRRRLGSAAVGGCFCGGQIASAGSANGVYGYSTALTVVRPAQRP